jgi:hypothetical protein
MNHEERLQFIWKNRLLPGSSLKTTCGLEVEVIHPGAQNSHAGPDFFNARIKLGPLVWAGNVEMHLRSSHWNHHGHHLNPAYDNVILHVVHQLDDLIKNSKGRIIPTLVVDPSALQILIHENLSSYENWLPCNLSISNISKKSMEPWLDTLYIERLSKMVRHAAHILTRFPHNRDKALFLALASGFGLPINSLPFEIMASGIPLPLLMEIKESLPLVEALLFGHSGLLNKTCIQDPYTTLLMKHYTRLKVALPGNPLPPHLWKFLRIRPASFPTLRLAQFASFIHFHFPLDEGLMNFESLKKIEQILQQSASEYWNTHYIFGRASPHSVKTMGRQAIQHLIINVIIPYLGAIDIVDHRKGILSSEKEKLLMMSAESNHIVRNWSKSGVKPHNAFESQALIQLYNGYCVEQRCDQCFFGKIGKEKRL